MGRIQAESSIFVKTEQTMKHFLFLPLAFAMTAFTLNSDQPNACDGYWLMKQGVTLEYQDFNAKEKFQGGQEMKITSMTETEGGLDATIHSVIKDDKNKVTSEGDYAFTCKNGEITIDMRSMMSNEMMDAYKDMEVSIDQSNLTYPTTLTEGKTLPDGTMTMKVSSSGISIMTMTVLITERKVEKFESITTPAGTFECVRMSQVTKMDMGMMKTTTKSVDWFTLGLGSVRNESYDKNGDLQGYRILSKISE